MREASETTTRPTVPPQQKLDPKDKAQLQEEERLATQKEEEANITLIAEWDNVQAMMDADHELGERLQAKEQGELTIKEREDIETLWKLVKSKYGNTKPEEANERVLWGDLKSNCYVPFSIAPLVLSSPCFLLFPMMPRYPLCPQKPFPFSSSIKSHVGIKMLLSVVEVTAASYEVTTAGYGFYCW
nr:hypothetical protein [Tanacetum cinerariifolium]